MNDFWDVIQSRRSVRHFTEDPVSKDLIEKCLSAANCAPSGGNQKNWKFIVVQDKDKIEELQTIVEDKIYSISDELKSPKAKQEFKTYSIKYFTFFANAPVLICIVMKPYDSLTGRLIKKINPDTDYQSSAGIQSVAAATENLLLAAASVGLGTCWMTGPLIAKTELEKSLIIKSPESLFALVPVGYPAEEIRKNQLVSPATESVDWI